MGHFPDPRLSTKEGLVAYGGELSPEILKEAYAQAIFPWPQGELSQYPMLWFSPDPRGILDFKEFHIPKSWQKTFNKNLFWKTTTDRAFAQVMEHCRIQKRKGQAGTWILNEMIPVYEKLHQQGKAISVEVWHERKLVGGIYGVIGEAPNQKYFSGESMFHLETGASKRALVCLIEELKLRGFTWMDLQMVTSTLSFVGGKYIPREDFLKLLGI